MTFPNLTELASTLPIDDAVRIEVREGIPMFRATPRIQERIEELLDKQTEGQLAGEDARELDRYEELDAFLSLVNRLVRNSALGGDFGDAVVRTA